VRNLAARDRENQLSAAEKTMYDRARLNLISEIAPSKKCSTEEATRFLDQALERGVLKVTGKAAKSDAKASVAKTPAKAVSKAVSKTVAKAPAKKSAATAKAAAKKK
jgi:hypothetical protein